MQLCNAASAQCYSSPEEVVHHSTTSLVHRQCKPYQVMCHSCT